MCNSWIFSYLFCLNYRYIKPWKKLSHYIVLRCHILPYLSHNFLKLYLFLCSISTKSPSQVENQNFSSRNYRVIPLKNEHVIVILLAKYFNKLKQNLYTSYKPEIFFKNFRNIRQLNWWFWGLCYVHCIICTNHFSTYTNWRQWDY